MGILFIPMFLAGIVMMCKTPDLLRKRLQAKEKQEKQKQVVLLSGLMFIVGFVSCGLNHRFQWCVQPKWLTVVSAIIFLLGYLLYAQVLRENAYLSRTIEVQQGQRVIDTGLYGVVRHPMLYGDFAAVLLDAAGTGIADVACVFSVLSIFDCEKDTQRGTGAFAGVGRLCGISKAGKI